MLMMGFGRRWGWRFLVGFCLSALSFVKGLTGNGYDPESLDVFVRHQAWKAARPYTGRLYRVRLPANFSTMEVSIVRLRSGGLWARGVNFSCFHIPPRTLPAPFVKRLAIVYENLGNLSSHYYSVPGFSIVSPVLGFMAYDATNLSALDSLKLNFSLMGGPISVHFPSILAPEDKKETRCVAFGDNGAIHFSNLTTPNSCIARGQGHFSIVVPTPPAKKQGWWKWWAVGFGGGFAGLVIVVVPVLAIVKVVKKKKMGEMERESETSEALSSVWLGRSRVPSATMIRTQPVIEHSYVP